MRSVGHQEYQQLKEADMTVQKMKVEILSPDGLRDLIASTDMNEDVLNYISACTNIAAALCWRAEEDIESALDIVIVVARTCSLYSGTSSNHNTVNIAVQIAIISTLMFYTPQGNRREKPISSILKF